MPQKTEKTSPFGEGIKQEKTVEGNEDNINIYLVA